MSTVELRPSAGAFRGSVTDTEGHPVKAHVIVLGEVLEGQAQRQADMAAAADDDDVGHGAAAASGLRDR